ncbi:MAG: DMT family transporter [Burkholderiales bacterium]
MNAPDATSTITASSQVRRLHHRAILILVICTALWSTAGVATRFLERAEGFEIAFWRALSCMICIAVVLMIQRGRNWLEPIRSAGWAGWISALMWAVMFTCFMLALTRTTVANVLVVMAASPLIAALMGRTLLNEFIGLRTWTAIAVAGLGMIWMTREGLSGDGLVGMAIAAAVPFASAINLVILKKAGTTLDLGPSVMMGAMICALVTLPMAWPLGASLNDLAIIGALGAFQLALPCLLLVSASRYLAPQEIALLCLLEVVLGPLYAWVGVGERPTTSTLQGGALVLAALVFNAYFSTKARSIT